MQVLSTPNLAIWYWTNQKLLFMVMFTSDDFYTLFSAIPDSPWQNCSIRSISVDFHVITSSFLFHKSILSKGKEMLPTNPANIYLFRVNNRNG